MNEKQKVRVTIESEPIVTKNDADRLTPDEFDRSMEEFIADMPDDVPPLPDDFSRIDCYEDRE